MVSYCANPNCGAEFLYLHEGELFIIELPHDGVEHYWLCPACARYLRVVYDISEGAKVVPKARVLTANSSAGRPIRKPAPSETVRHGSFRHVWS
jgi:hypothetical protein